MAFHITPDGPKPCRAQLRTCRYGEHYGNREDATAAYEQSMELALGSLEGLSSPSPGEQSAEIARAYSHWSIANGHLHNSDEIGSPQELYYYSSPQGRLELQRRIERERGSSNRYQEIAEALEHFDPQSFDPSMDEEQLRAKLEEAQSLLPRDSSFLEEDPRERKDPALRHYLVEESHRWLSKLTPEEQEAISSLTSDGFKLIQYAEGYLEPHDFPRRLIDEDSIYDSYGADYEAAEEAIIAARRELAEQRLETVRRAFSKIPRHGEPITIARGSSLEELSDILGTDPGISKGELMDRLEAGDYDGKPSVPTSRLSRIPQSATIHGKVAKQFAQIDWDDPTAEKRQLLIAIKSKSFGSPANVSAWGTAELEVYTNPLASYRITRGRRQGDRDFILELEEL